ncbi:MAG: Ig-like domain-containing protein [Clostridiaceae bacterium]|nr:Ig-like domain-containing protein [Clostridiaceae bacterium]MBW4860672.1 Ig-like domain-containing protein [Clostridiaceae bacterium]MBW4868968.1 Ig-like domain-containing protein [Clostridiaceae bacterium]
MKQDTKRFLSLIIVFAMTLSTVSFSFAETLAADKSTLELDKEEVLPGETLTLKMHLADFEPSGGSSGGPPISVCNVHIYKEGEMLNINGRPRVAIFEKDVDSNGDAELKINIPEEFEPGEYQLQTTFLGAEGSPEVKLPFTVKAADKSTAELDKTKIIAGDYFDSLKLKVHLAGFKPSENVPDGVPMSACTVRMYKTDSDTEVWSGSILEKDVDSNGDAELEIAIPQEFEGGEYELHAILFGATDIPTIKLPFKVIAYSSIAKVEFEEEIEYGEIDSDVIDSFYIGPKYLHGEFMRDGKIEVKLNGEKLEYSSINSGAYGNGRHIYKNVRFTKHDNVLEVKVFDSEGNQLKVKDDYGEYVDTLIKHVINTSRFEDDEEPLEIKNVVYYDSNEDGKIGNGDKLVISFNKEIKLSEDLGTSKLFDAGTIKLTDEVKVDGFDLTIGVADSPSASFYNKENHIKSGINISSITDLNGNSIKMPKDGIKVQVPKVDKLKIVEAEVVKDKGNSSDKFEIEDKIVFKTNRPVNALEEMVPGNFILYKENDRVGFMGDIEEYVKSSDGGKEITLTVSKLDKDWLESKIEDFKTFSVEKVEHNSAFADAYGNVLDTSETKGIELKFKDKEAPKIGVEGLIDGQRVLIPDVDFKVKVTDNIDLDIEPIVKLNEEIITGTNGEYKVVLEDGENTITIEATDVAGNKSDITYKLIYKVKTKGEITAEIDKALPDAVAYATVNNYSNDWVTAGLGRLDNYKDKISSNYLDDTAKTVKALAAQQDKGGNFKVTDFERITMGVNAAGGDPTDIDGINMIERIYNPRKRDNGDYISRQGLNAVIWGLIAVDSGSYNIPDDAEWNRDRFIQEILDNECHNNNHPILKGKKGGWQYGGKASIDPDMTGMAMIALAPYNKDEYPEVQAAINRAVKNLSLIQREDGGYASWGTINSESCVQVIMGLCANNIDPIGEEFTKKGGNAVDALLSFKVDGTGFAHAEMGGELHPNGMANEQALYGLSQLLYSFDGNEGSIFKWEDKDAPLIEILNLEDKTVEEEILKFKVTAKDYVDGEVEPVVKINEEAISGEDGNYQVKLKEGKNTITIRALDSAGNERNKTYEIIYEKEKVTVDSIELINGIELDYGTSKEEVLEKLPAKVILNLSNGTKEEADVNWTNEDYAENKAGDYTFVGSYELPEGVTGEKPEVNVKVKVRVKEEPKPEVNKDKLKEIINKTEKLDLENKTEESIKALNEAIAKGKEILNKKEMTQEDVDSAVEAIKYAINSLKDKEEPVKPTEPTEPQEPNDKDLEKPINPTKPQKPNKPGTIDKGDNKPTKPNVEDKPAKTSLPKTGQSSMLWLSILGIILLVVGAKLWIDKRKEKEA